MSSGDVRTGFRPWEYVVWALVTISLLLTGVVLWVLGLMFRVVQLIRKPRPND